MNGSPGRRVLLVHRHFDPDMTTYAQMLAQYAEHLGRLGHEVTVLCGPANYNGVYDGPNPPRIEQRAHYSVRRARLPGGAGRTQKLLGFLLFPFAVIAHCWGTRRPYDLLSVTTMPPVVMGVAGALGSRRGDGRFVYHCMDLYPELLGRPTSAARRLLASVARRVDTAVMRRAERVIVLSDDMADTVRARGAAGIDLAVCNNFIIETFDGPLSGTTDRAAREESAPTRLIFAGNLGRFQGIGGLIDAFGDVEGDAELLFLGAGPMVDAIIEAGRTDPRVRHHPHVPLDEAMQHISDADIAIVSLEPGVIASAYPSKVLMYLELGRPLLALVEPDSALARTVTDEQLGATAAPGDRAGIAAAIRSLVGDETTLSPTEIQRFGRQNFSKDIILARWTSLYGLESP